MSEENTTSTAEETAAPRSERPEGERGDRPYRPRSERPEGERGDRPYRPREDRGDRPYRPREDRGDRPYRPREERGEGGERREGSGERREGSYRGGNRDDRGRRGGDNRRRGGFRHRRRRQKVSKFDEWGITDIDYKDVERLKEFLSEHGKILSRRVTGNRAKHQRRLTRSVKRARYMALLPYVGKIEKHRH